MARKSCGGIYRTYATVLLLHIVVAYILAQVLITSWLVTLNANAHREIPRYRMGFKISSCLPRVWWPLMPNSRLIRSPPNLLTPSHQMFRRADGERLQDDDISQLEPIPYKQALTPLPSTYDHTHKKARDPVRSPLVKLVRARLVVGSVTTSESLVLYVFFLCLSLVKVLSPLGLQG
jgi:hypothetical protein